MSDREEVLGITEKFFEIGKTKNLEVLKEIQVNDSAYSSFSYVPPYDLKDYSTTIALEELRFVSISDYNYAINNVKVNEFGDTAVVALEIIQKGMLVDNKAFTGEHITIPGRATFVLIKKPTWKIVHLHLSKSGN